MSDTCLSQNTSVVGETLSDQSTESAVSVENNAMSGSDKHEVSEDQKIDDMVVYNYQIGASELKNDVEINSEDKKTGIGTKPVKKEAGFPASDINTEVTRHAGENVCGAATGDVTPRKRMIPNESDIAIKRPKLHAGKDDRTETTFSGGRGTNDGSKVDNSVPNDILQKRVSLVKLYAWIKNEMSKTSAKSIADYLFQQDRLSRDDHEAIQHCSWRRDAVEELLKKILMGPNDIFDMFLQALQEPEHHIAEQLKNTNPTQDEVHEDNTAADAPCTSAAKQLCEDTEHHLLTSIQEFCPPSILHTFEQQGFNVGNVENGSIVIELYPISPDSWRQLEENCTSGKIKDCISAVYNNDAIQDLLQEGMYSLQLTIYTIPTDQEGGKKALFHLGTEHEAHQQGVPASDVGHHDSPVEDYMDILCEELEISTDLLKLLKEQKIVEYNIKEDIDNQGSRAKKNKYLLNQVSRHGNRGYEVLKQHIQEANEDLYKVLGTYSKQVFFNGTAILKVEKNVEPTKKEDNDPDTEKRKLEISCPEIINSVCHFTSKYVTEEANMRCSECDTNNDDLRRCTVHKGECEAGRSKLTPRDQDCEAQEGDTHAVGLDTESPFVIDPDKIDAPKKKNWPKHSSACVRQRRSLRI